MSETFDCECKISVECCIKNYKRPLGKKRKFTILKIRYVTVCSSVKHKQCDVIGDLRIPNLREHDISNIRNNTLLSLLSQTYF